MYSKFVVKLVVIFVIFAIGLSVGVKASEAIRQGNADLQAALLP